MIDHFLIIIFVVVGTLYYTKYVERYHSEKLIVREDSKWQKAGGKRSAAFDFLKIFLTVLVVCHHATVQFGNAAGGLRNCYFLKLC